jgi:uncharacterized membrane protein YeaQ/YmgE (transglycosylase-associated protein family)
MGVITWTIFGFMAGIVISTVDREWENRDLVTNSLLGILGALIGGLGTVALGYTGMIGFSFSGFIAAMIGSLFLLAYRKKLLPRFDSASPPMQAFQSHMKHRHA